MDLDRTRSMGICHQWCHMTHTGGHKCGNYWWMAANRWMGSKRSTGICGYMLIDKWWLCHLYIYIHIKKKCGTPSQWFLRPADQLGLYIPDVNSSKCLPKKAKIWKNILGNYTACNKCYTWWGTHFGLGFLKYTTTIITKIMVNVHYSCQSQLTNADIRHPDGVNYGGV